MGGNACINENGRKFRGRKLILNWGNLKVEISKLPYLNKTKDHLFDLFESDVLLANVYENSDTNNIFWCLPNENIPEHKD